MQNNYIIAKYLRLSMEDGDKLESESISHQRDLLDLHIKKLFPNKNVEVIELIDDGYSGTNMNRPGIKKLLVLAETHGIDCIIVKDFSRFARDYIDVGHYAEQKFPEWEIRFISVNDEYDSKDYRGITGGTNVALKNLANTMYSRDLSEKMKSVKQIKYKRGEFLSPYAIYGYAKDVTDKHRLVIDKEAAEIVRKIFDLKIQNIQIKQIAALLNKDGIPCPAEYKKEKGISPGINWRTATERLYWCDSTVRHILHDERYTGKMINRKTERVTVGGKELKHLEKEDYIVVPNTHEPIISQKIFDAVQGAEIRRKNKRAEKTLFSGLIKCGGCRRCMTTYSKADKRKYYCRYNKMIGDNNCFEGKVFEKEIFNIVSEAVKNELIRTVHISKMQKKLEEINKIHNRKIQSLQNKISGFKKKRIATYVKLSNGQIDDKQFQEQDALIKQQILECESGIEQIEMAQISNDDLAVMNLFKKYVDTDELTNDILSELIKGIYVYDDKRIEIVWNLKEQ